MTKEQLSNKYAIEQYPYTEKNEVSMYTAL